MTTTGQPTRRLTGFTPSGHLHIGNLLGAIRPVVAGQDRYDTIVFLSDLHALTLAHDPQRVRELTLEQATILLAAGVDPERVLFYAQSQVPEHTELHYLLECVTGYGEAHRMIQFKEKSALQRQVRLSLLTYPVLMAADILLHDSEEVPVGDDQAQHLELTRDIATRFNTTYGHTFTVPRAVHQAVATRVMDLTDPTRKMSKSSASGTGTLFLLDPPEVIHRKVLRAVTDSGRRVEYDPVNRPGVANLLEILAGCLATSPTTLAAEFSTYGDLKRATADAVIALTESLRRRYAELSADPDHVRQILAEGAIAARERTVETVARARTALGLLS